MPTRWFVALAMLASGFGAVAVAQSQPPGAEVTVDVVQGTGWLVRGDKKSPVAAGTRLVPGDVVATGPGARMQLRFGESATVRLGESSEIRLWMRQTPPQPGAGAEGAGRSVLVVHLLGGVGRLINEGGGGIEQSLMAQAGDLHFILREGDVLARGPEMSEMCLVTGQALVRAENTLLTLDEPNACYSGSGFARVEPGYVDKWLARTDLRGTPRAAAPSTAARAAAAPAAKPAPAAPKPAASKSAGWFVNVAAPEKRAEADALLQRLQRAGHAAEIVPIMVKERQHYRVRIGGLPSQAEAAALARRLAGTQGIGKPWVSPD